MKTQKILTIAFLVASTALLMTACDKGSTHNIWKGYYPGSTDEGMMVNFTSKTKAEVINFKNEGQDCYQADTVVMGVIYNAPYGEFKHQGHTVEFEINGKKMTVYIPDKGAVTLEKV